MFGLLGGAKWFLVTVGLPVQGGTVGTMQMHQFKSEAQCEAVAKSLVAEGDVVYSCMSEEDFERLLKYNQQSPVFKLPRAEPDAGQIVLIPKCLVACEPVVIQRPQ